MCSLSHVATLLGQFGLRFKFRYTHFQRVSLSHGAMRLGQFDQQASVHFVSEAWVSAYCLINKCYRREVLFDKRCLIKDVTEAG
jgi:hypothetical protein